MSLILWATIDSGPSLMLGAMTGGRVTLRGSFELDAGGCVSPSTLLSSAIQCSHRALGYLVKNPWSLAACAPVDPGSSISPPMWLPHTRGHHKGFLREGCTCLFAGLPSAMAAKLVKPDVAVMAIVGDGGFMMNSQVGGTPQIMSIHVNLARHVLLQHAVKHSCVLTYACMWRALCTWLMPRHGYPQECLLTCQSRCRARSACHLKLTAQTEHHANFMKCDRLIRHHIAR